MKTYRVNEIFCSIQGEGIRAGTPAVFVRFAGCNMRCDLAAGPKSPGGFQCDTEFESGVPMNGEALLARVRACAIAANYRSDPAWIILTGGEPALQVDRDLCELLRSVAGFKLAIETNGSIELPRSAREAHGLEEILATYLFDWITVSPKVAEHAIKQTVAHEVKYVRAAGQSEPRTMVGAMYYLLSPATIGNEFDPEAIATCVAIVKSSSIPRWRMTTQLHKLWNVR